MRRLVPAAFVILIASPLAAACHYGFEADAFARVVPTLKEETRVFSPFFMELNCVIFAEALDTLSRAAVAESLGVLSGFESEYPPILNRFSTCSNGFSCVSARGFCVPEMAEGDPTFRRTLQRDYGVVTCRKFPVAGAESWFRAEMDGLMEDFALPVDGRGEDRFNYYDLICIRAAWREAFPLGNSRKLPFVCTDGSKVKLDFMADVRVADTLETSEFLLLRLPLRDGFFFYAFIPRGAVTLDDLRTEISSFEIRSLLASMKSAADPGVVHGPTVVVLPRIELETTTDVTKTLQACRCATRALTGIAGNRPAREVVQRLRFTLVEHAADEEPLREKPAGRQLKMEDCTRKAVMNRPFVFFVVDEATETIPVMAQFTGRSPEEAKRAEERKKLEDDEKKTNEKGPNHA